MDLTNLSNLLRIRNPAARPSPAGHWYLNKSRIDFALLYRGREDRAGRRGATYDVKSPWNFDAQPSAILRASAIPRLEALAIGNGLLSILCFLNAEARRSGESLRAACQFARVE